LLTRYTYTNQSEDLKLLLRGIALVSKLRTLSLELKGSADVVSAQQQSEMFAAALKECYNHSLEVFQGTFCVGKDNKCDKELWDREVAPIFQFNYVRRNFQETAASGITTTTQLLLQALETAEDAGNHHFRFWLLRNYAGDLFCTETKAASRKRKHKLISEC
jgi:hypothetical protein